MPVGLGIGIAGSNLVGGVLGNVLSSGDRNQALQLQQQALQRILDTNSPNIDDLKVALQNYSLAGQISPQMQGLVNQGDSQMKSISQDPRLREAQMQALSKLQQIGATGLRPEDQAALYQIRQQTEQDEQGREQAILQQMQQRGIAGAGAETAAKLIGSQGAANRQAQEGLNVGAIASQNALQAILNSGDLGGQIRGQEFGQQAQTAQAQDIINRYNAMNQQQTSNQNTALTNAAQAQNLANKQDIMNKNTGIANQQETYNRYLPQLNYQNTLNKNIAAGNATSQAAGGLYGNADRTANMISGIGNSVGQGVAAGGAYSQNKDYMDILKGRSSGLQYPELTGSTADNFQMPKPNGPSILGN